MVRIFPLIFVLLWSSAFITTKPIIDNSDPFAALAFRFFFCCCDAFTGALDKTKSNSLPCAAPKTKAQGAMW